MIMACWCVLSAPDTKPRETWLQQQRDGRRLVEAYWFDDEPSRRRVGQLNLVGARAIFGQQQRRRQIIVLSTDTSPSMRKPHSDHAHIIYNHCIPDRHQTERNLASTAFEQQRDGRLGQRGSPADPVWFRWSTGIAAGQRLYILNWYMIFPFVYP